MAQSCNCSSAPKLIFSCSGAADVGELADRVARKLNRDGCGSMYCLAGLGAELNNFIVNTKAASKLIVIEGCPVDCAKKILEKNGFTDYEYIRITDLGYVKGKTDISAAIVDAITTQITELLKENEHAV